MHRVTALLRPVQSTFELGCATEVFGTTRAGVPDYYEFSLCAETPGAIETTVGYPMLVDHGLDALDAADTVLVPGWAPVEEPLSPRVRDALLRAHARGARIVTICSGVFALARTGLLDGRAAAAHWTWTAQLQREFPAVRVDPARLFIDHGDVATSAGAGAALDLCLHLVRQDHGSAFAALLAQHMVLPPVRDDGQTQYIPPESASDDLMEWIADRLGTPLSVADLAAHVNVSPRTLARHFEQRFGASPGAWLLARRVVEARRLLEQTDQNVETIAGRVGLGSAANLRRRFRAQVGVTPGAYRRAFRTRQVAAAPPVR